MSSSLEGAAQRVRIKCNSYEPERYYAINERTFLPVSIVRGDETIFEFGLFCGDSLANISGVDKVRLIIKQVEDYAEISPNPNGEILHLEDCEINSNLTLEEWENEEGAHATCNIALTNIESKDAWLILKGISAEGSECTFLSARARVFESGSSNTINATPEEVENVKDGINAVKEEALQAVEDAKSSALGAIEAIIPEDIRTKATVGGFYFNGGSLKNNTAQISVPFSVCATIDSYYNGTIFTVGNTSAAITDGVIVLSDGEATISPPTLSNNIHTLVFVITSAGAKIFVDGVQAATAAAFAFSATSAGYEFWKDEATLSGRISRAKILNFDMSASGAAYTPQDYADGIEPNGMILAGGTSYTQDNTWTRFAVSYTVVNDDNGIGLTFTDPYSLSYGLMYLNSSSPIPAGSTVEISCGEDIGDAKIGSIQVQIQTESRANQGNAYVYPNGTKTNTITTTGDATRIEVWFNKDTSVSSLAGKTLKTSSLEVRINGAIVNLADFAQGYQAQDTSVNGNHAMLVGTALADKTVAQALVRGTYTWSGSTGAYWLADSNVLPANCQVELWAISSAAATLSLGYDTSHTTTFGSAKSVSTAWSSVASWVMGAIPRKLFVSPSAADLSIQFYLKITSIR